MSRYSRGKTRGGRVGGFPEPERAIRGAPEALRELRESHRCAESTSCAVARKALPGKSLPVRARLPTR